MTEPIRWNELSPEERDALVAEKVLGWELAMPYDVFSRYLWKGETPGFIRIMPRFSQNMDAAWQVLRHMVDRFYPTLHTDERSFQVYMAFRRRLVTLSQTHDAGLDILGMVLQWTPERICKAALLALGVIADD